MQVKCEQQVSQANMNSTCVGYQQVTMQAEMHSPQGRVQLCRLLWLHFTKETFE